MGKCCSCCKKNTNINKQDGANYAAENYTEIYAIPDTTYNSTPLDIKPHSNTSDLAIPAQFTQIQQLGLYPNEYYSSDNFFPQTIVPTRTAPRGEPESPTGWTCTICHFVNHPEMPHCEMCAKGCSLIEFSPDIANAPMPDQNVIPEHINQAS